MTKVFGSDDAVTNQINTITQGIGGDLIPIEANTGGVGSVDSVNGMIGDVILTTDDVSEGATNLYIDAVQETLITNAVQPADNISVLTNDAGYVDNVSDETIGGIKQFTSNETYFGPNVIGIGNTNQFSILAQTGIYLRENAPGNNAYFGIYDASLNWTSRFTTNTATHVWDLVALGGGASLQVEGTPVILDGGNVSSLTNDAGYITAAGAPVQTVFGRAGDVVAISTDYSAFYASTAQGALADTALQPGDNVSELVNDAGYVDNVSNETIDGEKTLSRTLRVQRYGSNETIPTLLLGADNGSDSGTLTDLSTKRARISIPNYLNSGRLVVFVDIQSNATDNQVNFGWQPTGGSARITQYRFALNTAGGSNSSSSSFVFELNSDRILCNLPVETETYTVGTLPTVINNALITVSDGDAGSPCLAVGIAGSWVRLTTGSAVSTTSRGLAPITIDTASVSSVTLSATHYGRTLYVIGTGALDINLDATADAGKFANVINHSSGVVQFVASGTTVNAPANGTLVIPQFGTASAFGVTSSIWQISGQTVPA